MTKDISTVIFDIGGTLVDCYTGDQYCDMMGRVAVELGVGRDEFIGWWMRDKERSRQRMAGLIDPVVDMRDACIDLGVEPDPKRIEAACRVGFESTVNWMVPRADAVSTIKGLKSAGYQIGIISNCTSELPAVWRKAAISELVDDAVFSCEAGFCKPDHRIFHLACERLGVRPQECVYVADGCDYELSAAEQVGMHPVLICVPYEKEIIMNHPDVQNWRGLVIERLSDIRGMCGC